MKRGSYHTRIFSIISLLLIAFGSRAQLYYKAQTLTTANGLSDNRVTCFHKDRKGFMWIGTRNGLNRFDGHSFRIYRPQIGNSVSNEVINDIEEGPDGRIWVATMEGLNIFDPVTAQWELLMPEQNSAVNDLPNYIVWDLWFDPKGMLWIASDVFEFSSYDPVKKKFTYYNWPAFARKELAFPGIGYYNSIQRFVRANDHIFWLGTTKGLVQLDIQTGQFSFAGGGYYGDVKALHYDALHQKVYFSVQGGKSFLYDERSKQYKTLPVTPEVYPSVRFEPPSTQEIWMASENGLIRISEAGARLSVNIPQLTGSLQPGSVNAVFTDERNIRWAGTSNGISVFDPGHSQAAFIPLLPVTDKEPVNRMGGAFYDPVSASYFVCAMNPAGVFCINTRSGEIRTITTDGAGRPLSSCMRIRADKQQQLWLLTEEQVYRYDRTTQKFHLFPVPVKLPAGKSPLFRDMVEDPEGNYWFSTFSAKLFCYERKAGQFRVFTDTVLNYTENSTGLAVDTVHKKVFIGTFGSYLYVYDLRSRSFEWYFETREARHYNRLNMVNDALADNKGRIWIATYSGGVFRYEHNLPYEKRFTGFDMRQGLDNNNILSMCHDGDSTLWLLSGNGISAMSQSGRLLYHINEQDLFSFSSYASDARNPHSITFNPVSKEVLTAVGGGLLIYRPARPDTSIRFPVVITDIKADGESLLPGAALAPDRYKSLSFSFAGLYYGSLRAVTYQYKLEGYDKEWQHADAGFTARYQNLPAGNYRFIARAVDDTGMLKGETPAFTFTIRPQFWNQGWFIAAVIALLALIVYGIVYSLQQKLKEEQLINSFATSLYGQHTVDDIFWDIARNCIEKIGFTDCVIYLCDPERRMLLQRAAFGPKNPGRREILNPIEIPLGKGIVGTVALTGKAEIIGNTTKDPRYIVDDEERFSEITVPVIIDKKVFAVIDSEHPKKRFYKRSHLRLLKKVAALCGERIARYLAGEQIRSRIARDLHDEMGSTLTSINITSKVAMQDSLQREKVNFYLQKIKDNSGRMMESMSDIVWTINPANDSFEKVLIRMKEFAAEILEPAKISYQFTEDGSLLYARLQLEQRKNLYMIFKEAINNAVKYSGASRVDIYFREKNNLFTMQIRDDGQGFDPAVQTSGNGLGNMRERAAEMNASLTLETAPGKGTVVTLETHLT